MGAGCWTSPVEGLLTLRPQQRVIMDNDWAGDPDGLAALAGEPPGSTAARGVEQVLSLVRAAGQACPSPVLAQTIVAEALRDDPLPLALCCGGPLTNVAAALRLAPEIAPRLRLPVAAPSAQLRPFSPLADWLCQRYAQLTRHRQVDTHGVLSDLLAQLQLHRDRSLRSA